MIPPSHGLLALLYWQNANVHMEYEPAFSQSFDKQRTESGVVIALGLFSTSFLFPSGLTGHERDNEQNGQ